MLVLSRRRDERILIGDDIEIVIVDIRGEKVRIGINAPIEVAVHRAELRRKADVAIEAKPVVVTPVQRVPTAKAG